MAPKEAPTPIIQNSIPVRYDSRIVVKPCEPERVPYLPNDILYLIAKALPQPKQVFNLALASKGVWKDLQGALYECEVTYEARLAHKYGGQSSASASEHFAYLFEREDHSNAGYWGYVSYSDSDSDSYSDDESASSRENLVRTAPAAESSREDDEIKCDSEHCGECDNRRIDIEYREFKLPMPRQDEQFRIVGPMTALHWAAIRGNSALPVAREAIRAALVHQPSYLNGLDLIRRCCYNPDSSCAPGLDRDTFADHPPPLFLAVAHGNLELFRALISAGADVSLLLGRTTSRTKDSAGGTLMCSKIHQQCLYEEYSKRDCMFQAQIDSNPRIGDDFLACQTVGHVAIQFEQTEMLQILLQKGLDVKRGSRHLLHSAVLDGNLAAVKVLLAHDRNLVHDLHMGNTPMHMVPFMENKTGVAASEGQLVSMVSCLLEHGAILDAPAESWRYSSKYSYRGQKPLESSLLLLRRLRFKPDEQRMFMFTAIRAVNVFLDLGSSWMPPLPGDGSALHFDEFDTLAVCLESTILLVENEWLGDRSLWGRHFDSIQYRSLRKAWGQACKKIIKKASKTLSMAADSANKAAVQKMLHHAFHHVVVHADGRWRQKGIVGWWALEAVGNLLLSTGMKPGSKTMRAWERIVNRDYEAPEPDTKVRRIKDCEELDGDKSEWAFLLEGVTSTKTKTAFPSQQASPPQTEAA